MWAWLLGSYPLRWPHSPIRVVLGSDSRHSVYFVEITGNAFLWHQVRAACALPGGRFLTHCHVHGVLSGSQHDGRAVPCWAWSRGAELGWEVVGCVYHAWQAAIHDGSRPATIAVPRSIRQRRLAHAILCQYVATHVAMARWLGGYCCVPVGAHTPRCQNRWRQR